jgi:hypothetical protein
MFFGAVVAACASSATAQDAGFADKSADDVSIFERRPHTSWRMGRVLEAPETPPNGVMPEGQNPAPPEFNFNITLTLRPNDRRGVHAGRSGRASHATHRGQRHRFGANGCRS